MIRSLDHARQVCARRAAAGKRGLPRAVVRFLTQYKSWRPKADRGWEPTLMARAAAAKLPYNP